MKQAITIQLSSELLDALTFDEFIYAEVAGPGAMGNSGGIMIYFVKGEELYCYETNAYTDEKLYLRTEELLFSHQNERKFETIKKVKFILTCMMAEWAIVFL